ncbi:MAG: FecR domain-containing protein [Agriterribacter sp.]
MNNARVFILLGKKLSNEATEAELNELGQLLEDKAIQPYLLELLQEVWQKTPKEDEEQLEHKWKSLQQKLNNDEEDDDETVAPFTALMPAAKKGTGIFSRWSFAIAACVCGIGLFSIWFLAFHSKDNLNATIAQAEIKDSVTVALNGERKRIVLPDSTKVHLNSGSKLVFKKDFGKADRQVWLTGEAFFEVTKDKTHPFFVNTNRMLVKVLGTVFNVKAYDTKEDIETTVVEGKVEVSLKDDAEKKVILTPHEKISLKSNQSLGADSAKSVNEPVHPTYAVQTVKAVAKGEEMPSEAVWVNEKMVFVQEPFETVALKMERWYNVRIHFENEKMKGLLMNGDFDNAGIDDALKVLQIMVRFKYETKGSDIYIK